MMLYKFVVFAAPTAAAAVVVVTCIVITLTIFFCFAIFISSFLPKFSFCFVIQYISVSYYR